MSVCYHCGLELATFGHRIEGALRISIRVSWLCGSPFETMMQIISAR